MNNVLHIYEPTEYEKEFPGMDLKNSHIVFDPIIERFVRCHPQEDPKSIYPLLMEEFEKRVLIALLKSTKGHINSAAKKYNVHRNTLRSKILRLGLKDYSGTHNYE